MPVMGEGTPITGRLGVRENAPDFCSFPHVEAKSIYRYRFSSQAGNTPACSLIRLEVFKRSKRLRRYLKKDNTHKKWLLTIH